VAERLALEGVGRLILLDRNAEELELAVAELRAAGCEAIGCAADVAAAEEAVGKLDAAVRAFGRLDILRNAAGVTYRGGIDDTDVGTFDRLFAVNTRAPFFTMQLAVRRMRPRGGVIVNVCSMLTHGGPPFLLAYSASKAALAALTKGAANAVKRDRIRIQAINLGWTVTPNEHRVQMTVHGLPETWAEDIGGRQPFGRLLLPGDVGDLVAFLVSSGASMMTGAVIDLDQHVAGTVDDNPGAVA
jgi:NAD(P)-dependent dehydrogenase (short-subunit alcohol dehydrogenase family)